MVNAYQDSEIWENTRGCSDDLEYRECTLVGKCFEMAVWKTEEIGVYCGKCHMTDRWPFK